MSVLVCQGDALQVPLKDESVHCVITSPPYFALRAYNIGAAHGELGSEALHDCLGWATGTPCLMCYLCHQVAVFREVKRVLRDDGCLFLNLGDTYNQGAKGNSGTLRPQDKQATSPGTFDTRRGALLGANRKGLPGLKAKDLCGIPWRVALALQADGWTLRSEIIWEKPSCMPESVTDRPTRSHEQVFLLTKNARYFFDAEAVKEPSSLNTHMRSYAANGGKSLARDAARGVKGSNAFQGYQPAFRNIRTVWPILSERYAGAHFATFPTALAARCILAGTSAAGCCPACKAPYVRQLARTTGEPASFNGSSFQHGKTHDARAPLAPVGQGARTVSTHTTGWAPGCRCEAGEAQPCVVLDCFGGSGTTALVARQLGRHGLSFDLSAAYLQLARERLGLTALQHWQDGAPAQVPRLDDLPLFAQEVPRG